jgi:hypothetical protein
MARGTVPVQDKTVVCQNLNDAAKLHAAQGTVKPCRVASSRAVKAAQKNLAR